MSSILPQIAGLQDAATFNFKYAETLLNIAVNKLLAEEEINVGIFNEDEFAGSCIGFDADNFEDIQLELRYFDEKFQIALNEHSEENFACTFRYSIFEGSVLYYNIPETLREIMKNVSVSSVPMKYYPNRL